MSTNDSGAINMIDDEIKLYEEYYNAVQFRRFLSHTSRRMRECNKQ